MASEGRPAFRHYVRLAEGKFKRLASRKYSAFMRGDEAIDRGSEPDVKIATVMFRMEGRRALAPPERADLIRYSVREDGRIDSGQVMDRIAALLGSDASEGNLIRAERRFHERAARWELTATDRDALFAIATRDAGFDSQGNRRQLRPKPQRCYVVRFTFWAISGANEIEGHFEALIRASSQRELERRARELAEQERSRGHIPWEAEVEMAFVAEVDPDDLASQRTIPLGGLGGALYLYPSGASEGVEWPPAGEVREYDEPVKILEPKPLSKRRASIELEKFEKNSNTDEFWVVRVTNLPQYPYEMSFFRNSERAALSLRRTLQKLLASPLAENPRFPDQFSRRGR